ncbi:hypothetical protein M9H77_08311 [Catharanthus roseus]|uniref:Uncharacterized protein n=1 Tax=Catharanthus roseus TaxID=4058 RepID=A0ACC0BXK8_CATRO|nr:hypothetical protein M9H77_08311 [Catharanthus roseus]
MLNFCYKSARKLKHQLAKPAAFLQSFIRQRKGSGGKRSEGLKANSFRFPMKNTERRELRVSKKLLLRWKFSCQNSRISYTSFHINFFTTYNFNDCLDSADFPTTLAEIAAGVAVCCSVAVGVNTERGVMQDEFNFTLVNFKCLLYDGNNLEDEPFILFTQAEQVWYVAYPIDPYWNVDVRMNVRDSFDAYSRFSDLETCATQSLDDRPLLAIKMLVELDKELNQFQLMYE